MATKTTNKETLKNKLKIESEVAKVNGATNGKCIERLISNNSNYN